MNLNILYGCDDNYAPYTGVSMTSLFESNRDAENITVYLAAMNFSEENLRRFRETAEKYGRNLVILNTEKAEESMRSYHCGTWKGSIATWLRFFVLDQIPQNVEKLLWLDSDTVVCGSLQPLFGVSMQNCPVGAVCDSICYYYRFALGLDQHTPYYNAGVILFNLPRWRRDHVLEKMMAHLSENVARYWANDQDLMNDYFCGSIMKLPQKYNVQGFQFGYDVKDYYSVLPWEEVAYYPPSETEATLDAPCVLHFFRHLGDYPWTQGRNLHPMKKQYDFYKKLSLWANHPGVKENSLIFKAEKVVYFFLPRKAFLKLFVWFFNRNNPKEPIIK